MLSNIELDHLNESDIGRCLNDVDGLKGWVRIESRPTRRVVVDFTMKLGAAGRQREQKLGTWPDRSLADIRRTADQLRRAPVTVAIALKQSPKAASTRVAVGEGASMTVSELFDGWHREALGDRKDAGESVRRSLLKDVMPQIGGQLGLLFGGAQQPLVCSGLRHDRHQPELRSFLHPLRTLLPMHELPHPRITPASLP